MGPKKAKHGGKHRKNTPRNPPQKSPTQKTFEAAGSPKFEMVAEIPKPIEQVAEVLAEPTVISTISEVSEKSDGNNTSEAGAPAGAEAEPLVTPEKVESIVEPVESAAPVIVVVAVDDEQVEKNEEKVEIVEEVKNEEKEEVDDKEKEEEVVKDEAVEEKVEEKKEDKEEEDEECDDEEEYDDEEEEEEEANEKDAVDGDNSDKKKETAQSRKKERYDSMTETEPEVPTDFDWEKRDEEYNVHQAIFIKSYYKKFAVVLQVINPEFRYAAEIGPCETFDSEGVQKILEKMKAEGFDKPWPFDEKFEATSEELRLFLAEVLNKAKFCLRLACAERGYEYKSGKLHFPPISAVWGANDGIDPIRELKTIKAIVGEMKAPIEKVQSEGQDSRCWAEFELIFETILPALETFDSKTLSENSISDIMATIHGRKELGFEITEKEVDQMLESSFNEDGFGEFPSAALKAPGEFKTVKQLKLIFTQLEKMSKVTDIRVKLAGVQTITRIFEQISDEEAGDVLEELKDEPKVPFEKMFGINPLTFDIRSHDPKRVQYLKMFYTALGENMPKEEFEFSVTKLTNVLKTFYLVFSALEVNLILFKIIGVDNKDNDVLNNDKQLLTEALLNLPVLLKIRLEIGPDYKTGEVTERADSMYFVVKHLMEPTSRDTIYALPPFLHYHTKENIHLIYAEKVFRFAMKCVETCQNQRMAVETLKMLRNPDLLSLEFSKEFFEDLLLLALSKYSVPDASTSEKKYEFITTVFNLLNCYKENRVLDLDKAKIKEKWTNMGHPWFSVLYLSFRFPILKPFVPETNYPWQSAEVWIDDDKQASPNELKNYICLAKVSTAWPKLNDPSFVYDLVKEHVPVSVDRRQLYKEMKEYVNTFAIADSWKVELLKSISSRIAFLTPTNEKKNHKGEKKEEKERRSKNEEKSKGKQSESKAQKVALKKQAEKAAEMGTQTSPMPTEEAKKEFFAEEEEKEKENEKKKEEKKEERTEEITLDSVGSEDEEKKVIEEPKESKAESPVKEVVKEALKEDVEAQIVEQNVESKKTEIVEEEKKEESPDKENITGGEKSKVYLSESGEPLKPLSEAPPDAFYGHYEKEQWDKMDDRVRKEISRQRLERGYSDYF